MSQNFRFKSKKIRNRRKPKKNSSDRHNLGEKGKRKYLLWELGIGGEQGATEKRCNGFSVELKQAEHCRAPS